MTFFPDQAKWLEKAEALKPALLHETVFSTRLVRTVAAAKAFQGWRVEQDERTLAWLDSAILGDGETFILDFGEHRVGRLSLRIESDRSFNDSPVRLKLIFAEVPAELAEPFDPFTGGLSRNWLQDEQITVDELPATIMIPRRFAFRYVRIETVGIPVAYRIRLRDITCETGASVPQAIDHLISADLSTGDRAIATASIRTLRDCMQTVFEDGPKRDRRLWIGDRDEQGIYQYKGLWWFINWHDTLDKQPCVQGLVLYCIKTAVTLAKRLGMSSSAKKLEAVIPKLTQVARSLFVAGKPIPALESGQVSWGAWAWLTKGGVLSPEESSSAFDRMQFLPDAVKLGGPYLMHYCLEALMDIGRREMALELVRSYWTDMLTAGLDTFPEVWDIEHPKRSPYGTHLLNSYCHAWSCTPVWLFTQCQPQNSQRSTTHQSIHHLHAG